MKMSITRSDSNNWTERRKIFSVVTCFSEMSAIYFSKAVYLFVSMFDSVSALLFLFVYLHLDTVFLMRRMKVSTEKSAVTKGHSVAS